MMIHVDATLELTPEGADVLVPMMREAMTVTASEEGCLVYRFAADITSAHIIHISELWKSEATLRAHMHAPSFQKMIGTLLKHARIVNFAARQGDLQPYDLQLPAAAPMQTPAAHVTRDSVSAAPATPEPNEAP